MYLVNTVYFEFDYDFDDKYTFEIIQIHLLDSLFYFLKSYLIFFLSKNDIRIYAMLIRD